MRILSFLLFTLLLVPACEYPEAETPEASGKTVEKGQWVYLKAEAIMKLDTTDYFLYGQLSKSFLEKLKDQNPPEHFELRNIRYVNDEDKLEILQDEDVSGAYYFKTNQIIKIDLLERDPIFFFDSLELSDASMQFKISDRNP